MDDINVKEIEVLRAYCSKLNDFKTGTSAVGLLVARQIDKIKDDLNERQREAQMFMDFVEDKANSVQMPQCARSNRRDRLGLQGKHQ